MGKTVLRFNVVFHTYAIIKQLLKVNVYTFAFDV